VEGRWRLRKPPTSRRDSLVEVVVERWWLVVERWWLVVGVREVATDFLTQNILNPHCGLLNPP